MTCSAPSKKCDGGNAASPTGRISLGTPLIYCSTSSSALEIRIHHSAGVNLGKVLRGRVHKAVRWIGCLVRKLESPFPLVRNVRMPRYLVMFQAIIWRLNTLELWMKQSNSVFPHLVVPRRYAEYCKPWPSDALRRGSEVCRGRLAWWWCFIEAV